MGAKKIIVRIGDDCIACGACEANCPVKAISLAKTGDRYVIDAAKCTGCGGCFNLCPVEAITKVEEK